MGLRKLLGKIHPVAWTGIIIFSLLGLIVLGVLFWQYLGSWQQVDAGAWRMTVRVERFAPKTEVGHCSAAPQGAREKVALGKGSETYQSGSRKGPCREDCTSRVVVGSYPSRTQRTCKTVCDSIPVFDTREFDRCQWVVDAWQEIASETTTGRGMGRAPTALGPDHGDQPDPPPVGAERRLVSLTYERVVSGLFGGERLCTFSDDPTWLELAEGDWFREPGFGKDRTISCFDRESTCLSRREPHVLCGDRE